MENKSGCVPKISYSPENRFRTNPEFVAREIAGEFILVPIGKAAEMFNGLASLNPAGVFLWKLLAQPRTGQELSDALAKEYELTGEQSDQDVGDFLDLAMSRNLVLPLAGQVPNPEQV